MEYQIEVVKALVDELYKNTVIILKVCNKDLSEIVKNEKSGEILKGNKWAYQELQKITISSMAAISMCNPGIKPEITKILHSFEAITSKNNII